MAIMMFASAFILGGISESEEVQAASTYVAGLSGKMNKCGAYTVQYKADGIYVKKNKGAMKRVVKISGQYYYTRCFTTNGKYIYYSVTNNDPKKGFIYRVDMKGKKKKKIKTCKHPIRVTHSYGNKVVYEENFSAVTGWKNKDWESNLYSYDTKKKKTKLIAKNSEVVARKGKYIVARYRLFDYGSVSMTSCDKKVEPNSICIIGDRLYFTQENEKKKTDNGLTWYWEMYSSKLNMTSKIKKTIPFEASYVYKVTDKYVRYCYEYSEFDDEYEGDYDDDYDEYEEYEEYENEDTGDDIIPAGYYSYNYQLNYGAKKPISIN